MKRLALLALAAVLGGGVAAAQQAPSAGQDQGNQSSGMQDQGNTAGPSGQTDQMNQPAGQKSHMGQTANGKHHWGLSRHFHGTVQAVDPSSGRLTIRDKKGNTKDFMAGSNAKIMSGRTKVSLDSLNVGDEVSVSYKGKGATPQAEKVWLKKGRK